MITKICYDDGSEWVTPACVICVRGEISPQAIEHEHLYNIEHLPIILWKIDIITEPTIYFEVLHKTYDDAYAVARHILHNQADYPTSMEGIRG